MLALYKYKKEARNEIYEIWCEMNNYQERKYFRFLWNMVYILTYTSYLWNRCMPKNKEFYGSLKGYITSPSFFLREGGFFPYCSDDIFMHMIELPFKEVPLYLNSTSDEVTKLAKWRLTHGH